MTNPTPTPGADSGAGEPGPVPDVSHETLMRYLDGELPPEERLQVDQALEASTELQRELAVYRMFRRDLSELRLKEGPGRSSSIWGSVRRRLSRPAGWILLALGTGAWMVHAVWVYLTSAGPAWAKMATSAIVIGMLLLLASVIVERWEEWQTDPYKDVER